jgi:beta-glucanase (GH16 family)
MKGLAMKNSLYLSVCCMLVICCAACGLDDREAPAASGYVPQGYALVWNDEFTQGGSLPDTNLWWFESGKHGWGNAELQNYIAPDGGEYTTAIVSNGMLKIAARKRGGEVISARMNSRESWRYGYFEARLKLPSGRGTWPAFWMLPDPYTPNGGEIDIMEEVGGNPNYISASVHTKANSKSSEELLVPTAESAFHIYAVEWTSARIRAFVDGELRLNFDNDRAGNHDTWPFDNPFYLKLNLAWGGTWGGLYGIDESTLPAMYEIDYVRVYQKQ